MKDKGKDAKEVRATKDQAAQQTAEANDSPELIKYRLLGAVVVFVLLALFGPEVLDGSGRMQTGIFVEIPERPDVPPPPILKPPSPQGSGFDDVSREQAKNKQLVSETALADREKPKIASLQSKEVTENEEPIATKREPLPKKAPVFATEKPAWTLQLATFSQPKNAYALREKLTKAGFNSYSKLLKDASGKTRYQVFVGPEISKERLVSVKKRLASKFKLKDGLIKPYRP